jgi:hypothetical protein
MIAMGRYGTKSSSHEPSSESGSYAKTSGAQALPKTARHNPVARIAVVRIQAIYLIVIRKALSRIA